MMIYRRAEKLVIELGMGDAARLVLSSPPDVARILIRTASASTCS